MGDEIAFVTFTEDSASINPAFTIKNRGLLSPKWDKLLLGHLTTHSHHAGCTCVWAHVERAVVEQAL